MIGRVPPHGTAADVERSPSEDEVTRRELERIARGGTLNMVGAVVSAVMGFLHVVIVTRFFRADDAGSLFSATSAFTILTTVGMLGTETGLARFMLPLKVQGRLGDQARLRRIALRPVMVFSFAAAAVGLLGAEEISRLLGVEGPHAATVVRMIALAVPAATLSRFMLGQTRAIGRMRPTVVIDKIFRSAAQPAGALLVGLMGGGVVALTNSWTIPFFVALLLAIPTVPKPEVGHDEQASGSDMRTLRREFWSFTWPRSLASVSQIAIQRFDIIVIAATLGAAEAAIYTAATRFVVVGQFGVQAIQQVLQPRMSAMLAKNQLGPLERVFQTSTAWNVAVAWPLYVTVACAAGVYLRLFGQGYTSSEAVAVVVTMSVAMMLAVAAGPLDTLLLMAGHSKASTINALVALAVNVALCLTLIPSMGIPGAGVAWAAAVVVRNVLTYVQVRKALGITPFSSSVGIAVALPVLAFAVPQLVSSVVFGPTVGAFAAAFGIGVVLYAAGLWAARDRLALASLQALLPRRFVEAKG